MEILIQRAVDNTLSDAGKRILHAHLAKCPQCAKLYQEYVELDKTLKNKMADVGVPQDLKANVMAAIDNNLVHLHKPAKKNKIKKTMLVAVAAALLLAVGVWWLADAPNNIINDQTQIADGSEKLEDYSHSLDTEAENENISDPQENDTSLEQQPEGNENEPGDDVEGPSPDNNGNTNDSNNNAPTYGGGISLPTVAYGGATHGSYSLYRLASHEQFDAILPKVTGNTVTYYLNADGYYLQWQTNIQRGNEPSFVDEVDRLPYENATAGFTDNSGEYGYSYFSDVSGDGRTKAINCSGNTPGLWLLDMTNPQSEPKLIDGSHGGGKVVLWAPDSSKVLYTSSNGYLYVYYPNEKRILDIFTGETTSVCWAGDSKNIVFSGRDTDTGRLSIFSVIVP